MKTKKAAKKITKAVMKSKIDAAEALLKAKKAAAVPAKKAVEKDSYGFRVGSKSSEAIKMLASGKVTTQAVRKEFKTLSFGILLKQVQKNGFKVAESKDGLCKVVGSLKA